MLKLVGTICALLIMAATNPVSAQAQMRGGSHFGGAHVGGTQFGDARIGAATFGVAPLGGRHYRGIYRGAGRGWHGGIHRGGVSARSYAHYGFWRRSFSPYWGWAVAAGLLASAGPYDYDYDYNEYGFEAPAYDNVVAYCMQRFRSYDPISGAYLGNDGNLQRCP
jgi:hypothetical protein